MSNTMPPVEAIPLPGETKESQKVEVKKPKLRRLQDTNQPSSILVTKVVATKSTPSDPASKLKAIAEKKKSMPVGAAASTSDVSKIATVSAQPKQVSQSSVSKQNSNSDKTGPQTSQSVPPSQTIVDELFKDFIATKKKEEQIVESTKSFESDIATSVEEMNRLLDEEISMIHAKSSVTADSKVTKKGRWDSEKRTHEVKSKTLHEQSEKNEDLKASDSVDDETGKKGSVKLGLKVEISKESLSWINSGEVMDVKKNKVLEEGEVLSSSSDENSDDESDDSDEGDDPRETGSVSSSDKDTKRKSKKRKKHHKHKHKKKKKHKNSKGERKSSKEKGSKDEKKSSKKKEKSEDGKKKEKKKEDKKEHKSKSEKRKKSKSRSRSPKKHRTRSRSSSQDPYRDRSKSPRKHISLSEDRFDEWDARFYGDRRLPSRSRSRSRSRERLHEKPRPRDERRRDFDEGYRHHEHQRDRDRGKTWVKGKNLERENDLRVKIDKSKLRKIAIANVLAAVKAGEQGAEVDLATLKAGGKSVEELTDFCKKISQKEKGYSDSDSDSDYGLKSDEEGDAPFINHPFKLRDPSSLPNIVMNIRNSKQLPVLTPQAKATQSAQLRIQFPVSSGSVHRQKEAEWVPVEKTTAPPTVTVPIITIAPATVAATVTTTTATGVTTSAAQAAAEIATASANPAQKGEKVFPDPPSEPIDIGAVISERLSLVRRLTENPYDVEALSGMHKAQAKSSRWAESKILPGQFLGTTGVQTLTQQELAGNKKNQAWLKKDQLRNAAPIHGGVGMWLLQKMGWRQGEGLGKNNEGSKEPLLLDFKVDRKGLTSDGENVRKSGPVPRVKDLSGKHPVSALTELCNKRKWGVPNFEVVSESGPDHKKMFLFKVIVNGCEYQPAESSANKKLAKAQAATVCLQTLGLIPR